MNTIYLLIIIIIIILIAYIIYSYNTPYNCNECNNSSDISDNIKNIENKIDNIALISNNSYQPNVNENFNGIYSNNVYPIINRTVEDINSLDRIFNPIRYPYKSPDFYDTNNYPSNNLPFQVMGGGYRNTPTLGGTQIPIFNPTLPINISNSNIAPINIQTRGGYGITQQIGLIYKINGDENQYHPLFGRANYTNSRNKDYYTMINGVKVPIISKRNDDLGNGDIVFIKGNKHPYTVTIYETDSPNYIPY